MGTTEFAELHTCNLHRSQAMSMEVDQQRRDYSQLSKSELCCLYSDLEDFRMGIRQRLHLRNHR